MADASYRIGTVARLAGLSTHVIRVWERRYGVTAPSRSEGGARLYSQAELDRLRLLKRAVDRGHPIGQLVLLAPAELERLAGGAAARTLPGEETVAELMQDFLEAVEGFDDARAERVLDRASVAFSGRALVLEVLSPLLERIGESWASGTLCTASEHVASALVRDRTSSLLRRLPREPDAKLAVVSTPAGELHEIGAMLAATTAKMRGWDVLYLGPNLPASQIALAAHRSGAEIVALSVLALDAKHTESELEELANTLAPDVAIVLGGAGVARLAGTPPRVKTLGSLEEFERFLVERRSLRDDDDDDE
jgi:MerR family transcriptional regulator, light-induced transcriptional regulator